MTASILPRLAVLLLLALAACTQTDTADSGDVNTPDPTGWRLASGKEPSKAEFAALAASCQDRGSALDACLAELGLKRAQ
jgi:hypothetical protein